MLELRNVSTFYGTVQALREVSLKIGPGEVVTIIGANGAGKTTLLKTVVGLVPSRTGELVFQGESIRRWRTEKIVSLGISLVPEGRQVFSSFTVLENLQLGAYGRYKRKNRAAILSDMEFVFSLFPKLKERSRQTAGTLSGGEQQMLAIGRGLMSKPRLLLLDEPSMGLAPMVIKDIFSVLKTLNEQGLTILLVEQDARIALNIADRGYVLQTGQVVLADRAENLIDNEEVRAIYFGKETTGRS